MNLITGTGKMYKEFQSPNPDATSPKGNKLVTDSFLSALVEGLCGVRGLGNIPGFSSGIYIRRNKFRFFELSRLLFSLLIIFSLFSCSGKKKETEDIIKANPEVKVGNPSHQKMVDYLTFNGNTVFLNYEAIRATFSGYIEKVNKSIGDHVIGGENLFIIRTKEARALDSSSLIPADVKFKGSVKINTKNNGTLIKMFYHLGDYVMDGEQLALLAAPQSLRVSLNVPFKYMNLVRNSGNIIVNLPDGRHVYAKIGNIMPSVDQVSQTQTVILTLPSNEYIPDSLNVTVMLPGSVTTDAIVLPKTAIQANETQTEFWVMKVVNDTIAVKINIKKGIENSDYVQIVDPALSPEDKFIIEGAYGLEDSTRVKTGGK